MLRDSLSILGTPIASQETDWFITHRTREVRRGCEICIYTIRKRGHVSMVAWDTSYVAWKPAHGGKWFGLRWKRLEQKQISRVICNSRSDRKSIYNQYTTIFVTYAVTIVLRYILDETEEIVWNHGSTSKRWIIRLLLWICLLYCGKFENLNGVERKVVHRLNCQETAKLERHNWQALPFSMSLRKI